MVRNIFKLIGIFIITSITFINIYNYYYNKINDNTVNEIIKSVENKIEIATKEPLDNKTIKKYKGVLEIPSINLKQGFYNIGDIENNVNKNILLLDNSNIPDIIALAAHSGNGLNAYFKNLHKMKLNDSVYIFFNNIKYKYKIIKIYEEVKDGNFDIAYENNLLILTTCKGNNQLIIIGKKEV